MMNDHLLNDPLLNSLEARQAASVPQLSMVEQHRLLYECAFAAGLRSSVKMVRYWQIASAALVLMVVSLFLVLLNMRHYQAFKAQQESHQQAMQAEQEHLQSEVIRRTLQLRAVTHRAFLGKLPPPLVHLGRAEKRGAIGERTWRNHE